MYASKIIKKCYNCTENEYLLVNILKCKIRDEIKMTFASTTFKVFKKEVTVNYANSPLTFKEQYKFIENKI